MIRGIISDFFKKKNLEDIFELGRGNGQTLIDITHNFTGVKTGGEATSGDNACKIGMVQDVLQINY